MEYHWHVRVARAADLGEEEGRVGELTIHAARRGSPNLIGAFYRDHPDGSIRTYMVRRDGQEVVFEARIYRTPEEASMGIYTSGWACSTASEGSALEGCESGAVTRALANLGYREAERAA